MTERDPHIVIVGAGLAGLRAAIELSEVTGNLTVLEQSKRAGGRVKTDDYNGYRLDRGFQVLLTAYPEARQVLDYEDLDLRYFMNGALVDTGESRCSMIDPLSHPVDGLSTVLGGIGTLRDRWLTWRLRQQLKGTDLDTILRHPDMSTLEYLREFGFSEAMITDFFRPFLSGIFLETELTTSSRMFEFVYKMFSEGHTALPAGGMEDIPRQMADRLPEGTLVTDKTVESIASDHVDCVDGSQMKADIVLVAAGGWELDRVGDLRSVDRWNRTACYYFAVDEAPEPRPLLMLDADDDHRINNLCFPSRVAPDYSPKGKELLSVSTLPDQSPGHERQRIEQELVDWFGPQASDWTHLKSYDIPHALPTFTPNDSQRLERDQKLDDHLYICGDHRATPSINGALKSGRTAAETIRRDLGLGGKS